MLSGILLQFFSWPSIFALNVVLAALALAGTLPIVPTLAEPGRCDSTRSARCSRRSALAAIVFGIIEGPQRGWRDPVTLAGLLGGLLLVARSSSGSCNRREPMLDPRLFLRRGFGAGSLSLSLQFFALFGFLFVALHFLQLVLGYSPLEAGLALLPMAFMLVVISPRAPKLAGRLGVRVGGHRPRADGRSGSSIFSTLGGDSSYWHFGVGAFVIGVGIALATAPATTAIVSSLPVRSRESPRRSTTSRARSAARSASRCSAASSTAATEPTWLLRRTVFQARLRKRPRARSPRQRGRHDAGQSGAALVEQAQAAFVNGLSVALLVGAGVLFAASVIVAVLAPRREDVARAEALEPDAGTESNGSGPRQRRLRQNASPSR